MLRYEMLQNLQDINKQMIRFLTSAKAVIHKMS